MCFSMTASVAAGSVLTVAGAAAVTLVRRRADLPLALMPLLFGVQQLVEGVVWWSLDHDDPTLNLRSTFAYMLFSHVLWPTFVPLAIRSAEVVAWRRRALAASAAVGAVVSLDGLATLWSGAVTSHVAGSSIRYPMPSLYVIALYLLATCVAALFSSRRLLQVLGAVALGLALFTLWLYVAVFVSVWCFFSAVLTVVLLVHVRSLRESEEPVRV